MDFKNIIISRTDSIGDVILTLPMAGLLKEKHPTAKIYFLGKSYTEDIINTNKNIDHFLNWDDFSSDESSFINKIQELKIDLFLHVFPNRQIASWVKKAGIKTRVGTSNRIYHWLTCNKLPRFSRKNSNLHEAQLNFKLLKDIAPTDYSLDDLVNFYSLKEIPLTSAVSAFLSKEKKNIILHPKSLNSAREWGIQNFNKLIQLLPADQYNIIITGTDKEGALLEEQMLNPYQDKITDTTGKLTLKELISLIAHADHLVAASTGPLHIAAMTGIHALGLFIMTPPMHPGRWKALGKKADFIVYKDDDLNEGSIGKIEPERVFDRIIQYKDHS